MSKQAETVHLLRGMTAEELTEHLREQRRKLFEVRFQQAAGQVENHRQIRQLRREIARTMTLQIELARGHHLVTEAELEVAPEPEEEPEERPRRRRGRRTAEVLVAPEPVEPAPSTEGIDERGPQGVTEGGAGPMGVTEGGAEPPGVSEGGAEPQDAEASVEADHLAEAEGAEEEAPESGTEDDEGE